MRFTRVSGDHIVQSVCIIHSCIAGLYRYTVERAAVIHNKPLNASRVHRSIEHVWRFEQRVGPPTCRGQADLINRSLSRVRDVMTERAGVVLPLSRSNATRRDATQRNATQCDSRCGRLPVAKYIVSYVVSRSSLLEESIN